MRLQKQKTRKVGNSEYSKWVIVIPHEKVKKLGWKEGEELEIILKGKKAEIKLKTH